MSCIVPKLLYGLHTAWLTKAQRRKLDGFHAKCLRKITGIEDAYFSRVSNKDVLTAANSYPLSAMLLEHQLSYFAKIFRQWDTNLSRSLIFQPTSSVLQLSDIKRRRGRPRLNWATEVRKHAERIAEGRSLDDLMATHVFWKKEITRYCRNPLMNA